MQSANLVVFALNVLYKGKQIPNTYLAQCSPCTRFVKTPSMEVLN